MFFGSQPPASASFSIGTSLFTAAMVTMSYFCASSAFGVGAALEQRLRGRLMAEMRRDMQRRAAVRILRVDVLAGRDQPLDLGGVALRGGGVQARIDAQLGRAGRDLGERGQGEQQRRRGQERGA